MDLDIDYKRGILYIRLIGSFNSYNIYKFEEEIIPIILELSARNVSINLSNVDMIDNFGINSFIKISNIVNRFNGKVVICDINSSILDYIKNSDIFDYCFKSKNENSSVGVFSI